MDPSHLWTFLPIGYLLTVLIEAPVLLVGLSRRHSRGRRLFAGFWLTACTYPIVVLVLPSLIEPRIWYLAVAETFAPAAECALFRLAFSARLEPNRRATIRDLAAIVVANLLSFVIGEWLGQLGWLGERGEEGVASE